LERQKHQKRNTETVLTM